MGPHGNISWLREEGRGKRREDIQKLFQVCRWTASSHAQTLHVDTQCVSEESLLQTLQCVRVLGGRGLQASARACVCVCVCAHVHVCVCAGVQGGAACRAGGLALASSPLAQPLR